MSEADRMLLSLCALLRWFDHGLLVDLAGCDTQQITTLLASDLVEPAAEPAGTYQLREACRADMLALLRTERPLDELTFHTQAFEYFLRQMQQSASSERYGVNEDSCFYHLGELRLLLTERREWSVIAKHVAAARAAKPRRERHIYLLSLYEGFVAIRTQDYDRGEAILIDLLDRADLDSDVRMLGVNALAQAHWFQGRYDRALVLYQQVHALASKIGNALYQGFALLNTSLVYHELGYYEQALNFSTQSLAIFRDLHDYYREAHALYEVGHNAMLLGRWQDAQGYFQEAIKLHESLKVMAGIGDLYWCQGFLHHMLGEEAQSEAAYLQALEIAQSPVHGTPTAIMDILLFLGFLYQTRGWWDAALDAYARSFDLASQVRNQHWLSLIHYRRGNIFERQGRTGDALAAYQQAIDGIEALRSKIEGEEMKIGLLGTTQQTYESIVLLCLAQGRPDMAFDYVERARSRAFLDVLAKKSPDLYDKFDQPVATLAEVQADLPPGALLLEYYTTGVLPRGESLINQIPPENSRLREHLTQPPHIYIFAITREHFQVFQAPLDPNMLRPPAGDPSPIRRLLRGRLPAQLYQALLAPAEHLLRHCELLYLIPHGPLHYVPFAALAAMHGQADAPALALAPSATVLLRSCLGRPPAAARAMPADAVRATHGSPLLALGYNDPDGDAPLRYAEAEAGHIARMLGGQAIVGDQPKREHLLARGPQARWLHIAGHAFYHPRDPLESELRTGHGESLSARTIAGELDLDADLVTLSACTSGVGQVVAGDELLGLQRAFLYAGARAVLCTLWEAADFVALLLMDRFYAELRRGRPAAVALRDAQAVLRTMTGRDVVATMERWQADDPAFVAALGELPAIPPHDLDTPLYADPLWWAPFTLIGKAD